MRSAAAKAAAARRKAAKEAAAAAAREAAEAEAADGGAPSVDASAPESGAAGPATESPGVASASGEANVVSGDAVLPDAGASDAESDPSAAPAEPVEPEPLTDDADGEVRAENPPLPPLPPISAEEAAASFAQADPTAAASPAAATPAAATTQRPSVGDGLLSRLKKVVASVRAAGAPARPTPSEDTARAMSTAPVAPSGTAAPHAIAPGDQADPSVPADSTPNSPDDTSIVEEAPTAIATAPATVEEAGPEPVADGVASEDMATESVLRVRGLTKSFGETRAVDALDLDVHAGSFYGIVGPNGAGKTTTLSMLTGLLRPDAGTVTVHDIDVWRDPSAAKRVIGVLPDRLRVFDRLTGAQLLYYAGTLRGLSGDVVRQRVDDLARAFGLEDAIGRLVSDYSAGMVKKVSLAAAMIHSPRILILDEPFESVDPVSAAKVVEMLRLYVDNGGTVVLSSHSMDFIQKVCDHVAIIVEGQVLASGRVEDVRGPVSLEERFLELAGGRKAAEGMEWLHRFSA